MPKGKPKAAVSAPQPAPKAPAAQPEKSNGKPESKMEGVRWALQKLGNDAKPLAIQDWLSDQYKIKMTIATIYNYKSTIQKQKGAGKPGPKPGAKRGRPPKAAPQTHASTGGGISLDDIRAVKSLADRIGAEKVRELAIVLAK
jgi:hypothetical protein